MNAGNAERACRQARQALSAFFSTEKSRNYFLTAPQFLAGLAVTEKARKGKIVRQSRFDGVNSGMGAEAVRRRFCGLGATLPHHGADEKSLEGFEAP